MADESASTSPSQVVTPGPPTGCAMLMMDLFRSYLHQNRLPLTHQREAIAMALFEAEHHQSVDDLADLLRGRGEHVGKATIYRTLNLLVEAGLARELDFGEGFKRYEHQAGETQHDYLVCTSCGKVARFRREAMDRLQADVASELGFAVQSRMLKIYGFCDACAGAESSGQVVGSPASVGAGPETG
ncbi:MAG: transcriptional repressor [Gemmatimonadetes bacterium]|nr:transcriptional repressor [Gemmatimonadota bacterium]NIO32158.1 transcriptional repressor [Gemmatimonadota bacterium]